MIHKRSFVGDDSYEVACKHPRHLEHMDHLASLVSVDDACQNPSVSDGREYNLGKSQDVGRSTNDLIVSNEANNIESGPSGSIPHFLWIGNGLFEIDNLSFFPEYFDHGHQLRAVLQPDEVFSSSDYPLRKPVSIGPEHQVFVPEWKGLITTSNQLDKSNFQVSLGQSSGADIKPDDGYERMMGTCVIPMPEFEVSATDCIEGSKILCSCHDQGSIECVKQHIMEARQKLRENLGEELFEGMGFNDMGEDVAKKWTDKEEQVFRDVILSNPVSLGKNFWEHLSVAFPSQKRSDLVSYYFNVFMLRKRAEQNRFDLSNIDSDNDEWQRSESGMAEGDEDSAVESLNEQDASAYYQEDIVEDCNEQTEEEDETAISKESAADDVRRVATDEEYEGDIDDISVAHGGISAVDCSGDASLGLFKRIPCNSGNDNDVEDDSCTSYEYQQDNADYFGPLDMVSGGRHSSQE